MSLYEQLSADNRTAMAVAAAIEQAMGPDTILTVGLPKIERPDANALPENPRVMSMEFASVNAVTVTIAVTAELGHRLEASAPDEEILTSVQAAFAAAATEIGAAADGVPDAAREIGADEYLRGFAEGNEYLVYPLLDGTDRVATLVIQVGPANSTASRAGNDGPDRDESDEPFTRTGAAGTLPDLESHEFGSLPDQMSIDLIDPRPLSLLHDVEMGVTAELGRRRMTVRDLLSLTPGAVIELDRAAGSPVDVLVNGTLIARGEVVVIDEEFGIRISEIVAAAGAGAR
jgi:flagellar motor switch protein FliN/FliY